MPPRSRQLKALELSELSPAVQEPEPTVFAACRCTIGKRSMLRNEQAREYKASGYCGEKRLGWLAKDVRDLASHVFNNPFLFFTSATRVNRLLRVLFRIAADSSGPGRATGCNTSQHTLSMAQAMHLPCCQLPRLNRSAGCSTSRAAQSQPLCRPALRQPQHARQSRHRTAAAPIVAGQPQAPPQMAPR